MRELLGAVALAVVTAVVLPVGLVTLGLMLLPEPGKQPVAPPVSGYKVVVSVRFVGSDGTLAAERDFIMPFVPRPGMRIDLLEIEQVSYSTIRQAVILDCGKVSHPTRTAREVMKVFSAGGKWKENLFLER